jgi:hypothetical protein
MESAPPASAREALSNMRIVSGLLLGGVLMFLAIALYFRQGMLENDSGGADILPYIATAWALLSLPIASAVRAARWPATTPEQDPEYWSKRRAAHVTSFAMLEVSGFICCGALLVSEPWWPLAAALVPICGMVAWFPRDE